MCVFETKTNVTYNEMIELKPVINYALVIIFPSISW